MLDFLLRPVGALFVASCLAACGGGGGNVANAGPCVVQYSEPVLGIAAARSASGTASASSLSLSQVSFNGTPLDLAAAAAAPASGVSVVGTTFQCSVPCGFGTQPGTYAFTASAPGFAATPVSASASYASFSGGCPASYDGGTKISVTLG